MPGWHRDALRITQGLGLEVSLCGAEKGRITQIWLLPVWSSWGCSVWDIWVFIAVVVLRAVVRSQAVLGAVRKTEQPRCHGADKLWCFWLRAECCLTGVKK